MSSDLNDPSAVQPSDREMVDFTVYAEKLDGGPALPSEVIIRNALEYHTWLGDPDPGFNVAKRSLEGVDFDREMLIAIGAGQVQRGTTVSVTNIALYTLGEDKKAVIRYSVNHAPAAGPEPVAAPYVVVKCKIFSGYRVNFFRADNR